MLVLIVILAAALARIIYSVYSLHKPSLSENFSQRKGETESPASKASLLPKSKETKLPPPPSEVYWSIFSEHLLEIEQTRATIITHLLPASEQVIKKEEVAVSKPESEIKTEAEIKMAEESVVPVAEISWATVGNHLIKLERQRERTFDLLAD